MLLASINVLFLFVHAMPDSAAAVHLAVLSDEQPSSVKFGTGNQARADLAPSVPKAAPVEEETVESVIVQYDNRNPKLPESPHFLKVVLAHNSEYFKAKRGHKFLFMSHLEGRSVAADVSLKRNVTDCAQMPGQPSVVGPGGCIMHATWGKVKAMIEAVDMYPTAKYFMFLDSDVAVNYKESMKNVTVPELFQRIENKAGKYPMYLQSDNDGQLTMLRRDTTYDNPVSINTGVILWRGGAAAKSILETWWNSSIDTYDLPGYPWQSFRWQWPYDQNRMLAMINDPRYKAISSSIGLFNRGAAKDQADYVKGGPKRCQDWDQIVEYPGIRADHQCYILHYTNNKEIAVQELSSPLEDASKRKQDAITQGTMHNLRLEDNRLQDMVPTPVKFIS